MGSSIATEDEDIGSCSPGGSIFPLKRPYPVRTHYRANEHRKRTSCEKPVGKVKWSDDPRDVTCLECHRAEAWMEEHREKRKREMPYYGGNDSQHPCPRCNQPVSNRGIAQASHRRKHLREFREEYVKSHPFPDAGTEDAKDRWEKNCEYAFRNAGPPI